MPDGLATEKTAADMRTLSAAANKTIKYAYIDTTFVPIGQWLAR